MHLVVDVGEAAENDRLRLTAAESKEFAERGRLSSIASVQTVRSVTCVDIILVPGLWLDASCWDAVASSLTAAGHQPHAMTLPGVGVPAPQSSGIGMSDWVDAVVAQIDECDGRVILVGHSAGGNAVWGAADARTDRVARVIFVDTVPSADGAPFPSFTLADGVIPFIGWDSFPDAEVADLDAETRAMAVTPSAPAGVSAGVIRLTNPARSSIPATVLMGSLDSAGLEAEIDEDVVRFGAEYRAIQDVEVLTIGSGHWPQLSVPDRLVELIIDAVSR